MPHLSFISTNISFLFSHPYRIHFHSLSIHTKLYISISIKATAAAIFFFRKGSKVERKSRRERKEGGLPVFLSILVCVYVEEEKMRSLWMKILCFYGSVMSMKIYVQQIRRFISIDGYYTHFFNIPYKSGIY